ncbi:MAG: galactokinase [Clostridia bacterium]|nr:galactokinase [Clostridia bacterium]
MNVNDIKSRINSGFYDKTFEAIYNDTAAARSRYLKALDGFCELYGDRDNIRLFSAPGRTEIGGNHTDHQHGCVLAGSVDCDVIAVVSANGADTVSVKSEGYPRDYVNINELAPDSDEYGHASALIRGVMAQFKELGYKIGGFDAYTTSNVLKGSGLSSSAAFEVLISNIVNSLFCEEKVDAVSIAKISQTAENVYFGKPSGLLDQMASSVGGFTYADFNDPKNPQIEKIDLDLSLSGKTLCVVDTGGNHSDLTGDYADITLECKAVSNYLGVDFLRDADTDRFYRELSAIRKECGDRAALRAFHFFNENDRVLSQRAALKQKDFDEFFRLVNESGESSYNYLQNLYSTSNVSEQGLSLAIALTKKFLKGEGACRVHGGGFAGTIQCYIPNELLADYKAMIEAVFGEGSCMVLKIRSLGGFELK